MASDQIPSSLPQWPRKPSLCDLPAELRLEICNHLLNLSNIARSYGYTGPITSGDEQLLPTARPKRQHTHAMLFVSKQFSAEYRQCYYERTTFFLRIDSQNAFKGVPDISRTTISNPAPNPPDFWGAPPALLSSLRHCTLFIELGEIASHRKALHSVSQIQHGKHSDDRAREIRLELKSHSSLASIRAQDALFDDAVVRAVRALLLYMKQLRSVQLVWDTTIERTRSGARQGRMNTNWTWESLGEGVVEALMGKRTLRSVRVKVGDMFAETTWTGERVDGTWEGKLVKLDG